MRANPLLPLLTAALLGGTAPAALAQATIQIVNINAANVGFVWRDFPNAPRAATWYPAALANKLAGTDLDPASSDIRTSFNSNVRLDLPAAGGAARAGARARLPVADQRLHRRAHRRGGAALWLDMTDAERQSSAVRPRSLAWIGAAVRAAALGADTATTGRPPTAACRACAPMACSTAAAPSCWCAAAR
ncbi:MAG: hypothetical protein LW835_16875 [Burkholderiaceae bacterium]|nr:hypothetical protein [Burkholderiaceae bacterium]